MDWQQLAALVIVAAAFFWLLRTQVCPRGNRSGCGGCGGCASSAPPPPSLIAADELTVLPSTRSSARSDAGESRV